MGSLKCQTVGCTGLITRLIREVKTSTTVVRSDPKAPFSIATPLRCRGGHYSFSWIVLPFTLDTYLIMLNVKLEGIKYHFFKSLVSLNLGLNPGLLGYWQTLYLLGKWVWWSNLTNAYSTN